MVRGIWQLWVLALRLLWPQRSVLRFVTLVCLFGIASGTMLQIVVRAVMDGMVREIDAGVQQCTPHVLVRAEQLAPQQLLELPQVRQCAEVQCDIGVVRGVPCYYATWGNMVNTRSLLIAGYPAVRAGEVLVSKVFAEKLQLAPGQYFLLQLPEQQSVRLQVTGIFRVPGRMLVPDVIAAFPIPGAGYLALVLDDAGSLPAVTQSVRQWEPQAQFVADTADTQVWLRLIATVKRTMGIILYGANAISAFAVAGLLFVICMSHRRVLSVLYAFGVAPWRMSALFFLQAAVLAVVGTAGGVLWAYGVILHREKVLQTLRFCGLDAFPTCVLDMQLPAWAPWSLYGQQSALSCVIVLLAALPAAWRAYRCRSLFH